MQELATASSRAAGAIPSKADRVREFEVFRYYNPDTPGRDTDDIPSQENPPKDNANALVEEQASSPDAILTALAQLCAIRLNASRAMIRYKMRARSTPNYSDEQSSNTAAAS